MAAAILRMTSNNEEREQYAANARKAFLSHFTLQAMVDSYMDLYRNTQRIRRTAKA